MSAAAACRAASLAVVLAAAVPAGAGAAGCRVESGPRVAPLIELYTSEGCDSCPPADRWLSSAFVPGGAAGEAVAVAFHVDYWDRLGWKDRFASAAFTKRQYDSARAARSDLVYTPQVLLQGRATEAWRSPAKAAEAIAAAARAPARAGIVVEAVPHAGAVAVKAAARVPAAADRRGAALFVALTESGLVSEVKAGENAGKRLVHDYVARALRGDAVVDAAGDGVAAVTFQLPAEAGTATSVVAFVQNVETGAVLQAIALPLAGACAPAR